VDRRRFLTASGLTGVAIASGAVTSAAAEAARPVREGGAYAVGPRGRQTVLWSAPITMRVVAVTFDDGPLPGFTERVLDVLAANDVTATFFMIGRLVEAAPSLARAVAEAGHEVANHSWSHASAVTLGDAGNVAEIDRATDAITRVTASAPRWYRPPRGMLTGAAVRCAHERGQGVALWSVTRGVAGGAGVAAIARDLVTAVHPGAVVDLHDGVGASGLRGPGGYDPALVRRRAAELAALPEVLRGWRAAGYRFASVSELAALARA
jgi:peptidoglycan/xylan/chitin deacetylase (PgdA/CDA1 family)